MKNQKINRETLFVAKSEAVELLKHAELVISIIRKEKSEIDKYDQHSFLGKLITANVLIGLSIEIFLKAFMIAGRNEGVVWGHNLKELYDIFPDFLKEAIEEKYKSFDKSKIELQQIALFISDERPKGPSEDEPKINDINDFNECLSSLSNKFVESRYFFEKINDNEWAIIDDYPELGVLIAKSLEYVLEDFINGKFKVINKNRE